MPDENVLICEQHRRFTGAGQLAYYLLRHQLPPTPRLCELIDHICRLAQERGVRLLFDGEQNVLQDGIDAWTMHFASKYNTTPGRATIFGTYQAYKKTTPGLLSRHLAEAQKSSFTLGVKLVRGAYLGSDQRDLFFSRKSSTDSCYDNCAASVLTRHWNRTLEGVGEYPNVSLMLATHNATSVQRAYAIYNAGGARCEVSFAQLQGMADEISCELVEVNHSARRNGDAAAAVSVLPVYKYMAWGTTGECMKYLFRRAQENRDAIDRTRDDRNAMWTELVRRIKKTFSPVVEWLYCK